MAAEQRHADRAVGYLMKTVIAALADGLAKIGSMHGDPVQNLGNYLLAREAHKEKTSAIESEKDRWQKESDKFKKNVPAVEVPKPEIVLPSADNTNTLLTKVCEVVKEKCSATAVYIGVVRPNEEPVGDEDDEVILYEASTDPAQLERVLVKGEGVVWDVLQVEEDQEEEDPENPRPPKERKMLHIPSLLVNGPYRERVHFWERPVTGAFLATPIRYGSHLFTDALKAPLPAGWPEKPEKPEEAPAEEAAAEEEEPAAEEVEVIPDPPTKPTTLIMCLDSTLSSLDFAEHIPWIRIQASVLEERLVKADQQEYLKHRTAEEKLEAAAAEEVVEVINEIGNLSHWVQIDKELVNKYHAIALAFDFNEQSLVCEQTGKPTWKKILAAFRTLTSSNEVKDSKALQDLANELAESSPSALSKILKALADLATTTAAAVEEEVTENAEEKVTEDAEKKAEDAA